MIDQKKLADLGIACDIDSGRQQLTLFHSTPIDPYLLQDIAHSSGYRVSCSLVASSELSVLLERQDETTSPNNLILLGQQISLSDINAAARLALNATSETDAPIIRLLDAILTTAISREASDLHFDTGIDAFHVKMRLDGVLAPLSDFDARLAPMMIARLKILGNLDITERRRPQDGRIGITYNGKPIDIRIASLPVRENERVVLRFFRHLDGQKTLQDIGLAQKHINSIKSAISNQSGIILVCGPTGSGKTTTIYSMLNMLRGRGLNIMTIEDPVEVEISGVVQSQVNDNIGFDFATGLRALLRHDPDVLLVGEVRDQETAKTAARAALTGHLVIASIHANSPHGAIMRMLDLGTDIGLIADTLLAVFNQRLIRTYCEHCCTDSLSSANHKTPLPVTFKGCISCHHTGFSGRVPIMEQLIMTAKNRDLFLQNSYALTGQSTLTEEAKKLHENGFTPFFEVARVSDQDG